MSDAKWGQTNNLFIISAVGKGWESSRHVNKAAEGNRAVSVDVGGGAEDENCRRGISL